MNLLFVSGKGGVGKTTVAATIAMRVAHAHPRASVLLLSTDPAHSLGDVFDAPFGDDERAVPDGPSNLMVRELDAGRALAERRGAFEMALQEAGESVGGPGAAQAAQLMDLAPPGVDELFGILSDPRRASNALGRCRGYRADRAHVTAARDAKCGA